jgi:3-deoxy-manno-octulosonate cytidylyltransferase (CMP-KDO synthetase)
MIWHVYHQAVKAKMIDKVYVATDDKRISDICDLYGIESILTLSGHLTGTDRVAECATKIEGDIFVNIQGDEPLINPNSIDKVIQEMSYSKKRHCVVNGFFKITDIDRILSSNTVKTIVDVDSFALAYSRHPIPFSEDYSSMYCQQLGLYAFTRESLKIFASLKQSYVEQTEKIEMLRFLEAGYSVKMIEVEGQSQAVDTQEDLNKVIQIMSLRK